MRAYNPRVIFSPHISLNLALPLSDGFLQTSPTAFTREEGLFLRSRPTEETPERPSSGMRSRRSRSTEFSMWAKPLLSL